MRLCVVMSGPPASGKGTQAARLARTRGIPQISTGDFLREVAANGTGMGRRVKELIDRGELLGDDEMIAIVSERLVKPDTAGGYILDGFPRTVRQARALDELLEGQPLVIIDLLVPDAELLRRMEGRRVCSGCAAIAHPASQDRGTCERCGGVMMTRADDGDAHVRRRRLEVYARESKPLLDYQRGRPTFRSIDGARPPARVAQDIVAAIETMLPVTMERRV